MTGKSRTPLFSRLSQGLTESLEHVRGTPHLRTTELPDLPPEIDPATLVALRQAAQMSQSVFARVLNVSAKTIQSWEQGLRVPSMASRRLLQVFSARPDVVCEIVGLPGVTLKGVRVVPVGKGRRKIVVDSQGKPRPSRMVRSP